MNEQQNLRIVQQIYENFLKGNLSAVLNSFSEDILWKEPPHGPVPLAGTFTGKKEVTDFFAKMNEACEILKFENRKIFGHENLVIAICYYEARSKATGKQWETEFVEIWRVDNNKIVEFQIFKDSAAELLAFHPEMLEKTI